MEKKSSVSDWRSRLASKFKKSSTDQYEVNGQDNGEPSLSSYRKTSHELDAPMTEPTRRRTLGSVQNGRKVSQNGEYDSEMVDGKYVTSVPILNPEDEEEGGKFILYCANFCKFLSVYSPCFIFVYIQNCKDFMDFLICFMKWSNLCFLVCSPPCEPFKSWLPQILAIKSSDKMNKL